MLPSQCCLAQFTTEWGERPASVPGCSEAMSAEARHKTWAGMEPFSNSKNVAWLRPALKLQAESLELRVHCQPTVNAS